MRPRPSCRGERESPGAWAKSMCAFNAATAFVPWRTAALAKGSAERRSPSMRPRPSCRGERGVSSRASGLDRSPSMRPRPSCRGERREDGRRRARLVPFNAATAFVPWRTLSSPATYPRSSPTLQCGHGLRAVENRRLPPPVVNQGSDLQCGHGLRAVENLDRNQHRRRLDRPSMRPRPSCRGEPEDPPFACRSVPAPSMRPRPSCRGEPGGCISRHIGAFVPSMRPRPSCRGERLWPRTACRRGRAFNAATAFVPWRT